MGGSDVLQLEGRESGPSGGPSLETSPVDALWTNPWVLYRERRQESRERVTGRTPSPRVVETDLETSSEVKESGREFGSEVPRSPQ